MENSLLSKIATAPKQPVDTASRPRIEQPRTAPITEAAVEQPHEASADQVVAAISKINDFIQITRRDLQFSVHDETGLTVVKVLDSDTQEVIRQIPAEEVLAIAANLEEVRGLLFQAKA